MIATDLWHVQIPLDEKVIRTVLVYGGLALLLRLGGKRDLAQLNSFDLVVMLLLSNVVQNAVIGNDNSLAGGLFGAAVLVAINAVMVRLVNRHPGLIRVFEGSDTVLIEGGQPLRRVIRRMGLRLGDIAAAVRRQGANDLTEVQRAVLSPGGALVVTLAEEAQDVTRADMHHFHQQLREELRADLRTELRAVLAEFVRARGGQAGDAGPA